MSGFPLRWLPKALLVALVVAGVAPVGPVYAQETEGGDVPAGETEGEPEADPAAEILALGDGTEIIYVVRHGERLSIYADKVSAHAVFNALESIGGPTYEFSEELTRPVTLTMHEVTLEQIVRKMLEGHSFTYHYSDGRLALVRVLPAIPGRNYKAPPAVESRTRWTDIELDRIAARNAARTRDRPPVISGGGAASNSAAR